jgi:hypothetical protein
MGHGVPFFVLALDLIVSIQESGELAFHGASANPASLHTTFPRLQLGSVVPPI